jgi:3',5'-cyclic AMP phosphodiesterase CpdA
MIAIKVVTFLLPIFFLFSGARAAEGINLSPLPDPDYSDELPPYILPLIEKIKYIIYPVLGFPAVVVAGESLTSTVSLDNGGKTQDWVVKISTHDRISQTYSLSDVECNYDILSGSYAVTGIVPAQVPREVFDLSITSESSGLSDVQPNAVRVITEPKSSYRFVHLTDLHVGDPRGCLVPLGDENNDANPLNIAGQVLAEISFFDPEFVFFSGDLVFGGPYYLEYPWAWEILSSFYLPIFMVPGNHDGYASGGGLLRDGLEYWKQVIGPPYYSFNYGDMHHFVCTNTYDGTVSQRDGFYFIVKKWGGTLGQEQIEWLGENLEEAFQQGRTSILLCHHDPRGDIHRLGGENNLADEDNDGYAEATEFIDMLFNQEWNDKESGEEMVKIIREGGVNHIFLGHVHSDFIDWDEESSTWWVHTTSAGSAGMSSDDFRGYRIIEVENNQIVRVNQTAPEGEEIPPGDNDPTNNQNWDYQSYATNNIFITTTKGINDGTSTLVVQEVENHLETAVSGVLKFYMSRVKEEDNGQNNYGYQVSGGNIRQIAKSGTDGDGSELIFYVETEVDSGETRKVTLEHSK